MARQIPRTREDYLQGSLDGSRYYIDGHTELMDKFRDGTPAYQLGFESVKDQNPRVIDPYYAT